MVKLKKTILYRIYSGLILYLVFGSWSQVCVVELVKLVQYYVFEKLYKEE